MSISNLNMARLQWMIEAESGAVFPKELFQTGEHGIGWGKAVVEAITNALDEIHRLQTLLKEVNMDDPIEIKARKIAALKMGLVKDPNGLRLPDELWRQAIPAAELETRIRQALARGYYHPDNDTKIVDHKLIDAMQAEVIKLLYAMLMEP